MTNYKKGLLSLATALALASSATASSYVPLTSALNDNNWIMFGVNGIKVDGEASATAAFASFGAAADTQITDVAPIDALSVAGLNSETGNSNTSLAEIKLVDVGATTPLTQITANVDCVGLEYGDTGSIRTMYIKAGGAVADVMFKYRASLENKTLEYQVNNNPDKTYTVTISATNTYDNPAAGILKTIGSGGGGGDLLNTIPLAMDYDLLDNPQDPSEYVKASHYTEDTDASTRIYRFNANTNMWEIYDSANSANPLANDFTELTAGKAYWAKVDLDDDDTSDAHTKAGLVLGETGLVDTDYDGEITTGWNLMSFDGANPEIRNSSTGMILKLIGDGNVTIVDSTGINSVIAEVNATTHTSSIAVNVAVESAKYRGAIPDTFDLKAFDINATHILLLSNKKFSVLDSNDTAITTATTMAGEDVWDIGTNILKDYAAGDINATGVSSVYGESGLIIKALVGAGTAAELDSTVQSSVGTNAGDAQSAAIQIGENTPVYLTTNDAASTLDTAATGISLDGNVSAITIDLDNNGTADHIFVAKNEPFYIRDHTFTRVMTYDATNASDTVSSTFKIDSIIDGEIDTNSTIALTVDNINKVADEANTTADTQVYAAATNTNDIVFVSAEAEANNFKIYDNIHDDFLQDTTSSATIAKGAVLEVYAINSLAKQAITPHKFTVLVSPLDTNNSIRSLLSHIDDNLSISINGIAGPDIAPDPVVTSSSDETSILGMFEAIVTNVKARIVSMGIDATVTHDYSTASNNWATAKLTVEGYGVTSLDINITNAATDNDNNETYNAAATDANSATFGTLTGTTPALTPDLKYNAIHTPDFAIDGPLYTLKDLGYTPKAIITASTSMPNNSIAWDSLDLTRDPTEWFKSEMGQGAVHNDYNLFSIDGKAGYWVYLDTPLDSNDLAISNIVITPSYIHHFNNDGSTVNKVAATLQVDVAGLVGKEASASVYANVAGIKVEMAETGTGTGVYSADITSYEVQNNDFSSITVSIADGTGYQLNNQTLGSIDTDKPVAPVVTIGDGTTVAIASTSTDTTGYYIFKDAIPEEDNLRATAMVEKILSADATSYNLCANSAAFGTYTYKAIAIDGTNTTHVGELNYGNASDATSFTFAAALKNASRLEHTDNVDTHASDKAVPYGSDCVAGIADTVNSGISIKAVTSDEKVKLSFEKIDNIVFNSETPYTIYVKGTTTGTAIAQIKYMPAYATKAFYVELDGILYSGQFPANDDANADASDPLVLTVSIPGQSL